MRRTLACLLALFLACTPLSWAADATSFDDLMKEVQEKVEPFREKGDAKGFRKVLEDYAPKFLAFAEKSPKDAKAIEALRFVLNATQAPALVKGSPAAKALALLEKDHLTNPGIVAAVKDLATNPDEAALLLTRAVLAKHPDKKAHAGAAKGLLQGRERLLMLVTKAEEDEKVRARLEKNLGADVVKGLLGNKGAYDSTVKEFRKLLDTKYADYVIDLTVGKKLPDFQSETLDGKKAKLSDLKGKVVVLDVWATWCGPCVRMIPHIRKLNKEMEGKPFVFVSISIDRSKETVERFTRKTPMPWTHWYNGPTGGVADDWEVDGIPFILVLDARGIIRGKDVRDEELSELVERLVKEAEKK